MLSENVDEEVRFIEKQFLCCVPVRNIRWNNYFKHATWSTQAILVANTVDSDSVQRYPLKVSYQVAFLKYIIDRLESEGGDINDCVYDAFGRLVALPDRDDCYKQYKFNFNGDKNLILRENPNYISQGTTGLCSWQASLALSEWCLKNYEEFNNRTLLELGAGVGLTGLVLALNCQPSKYYFTDSHPVVLKNLIDNVIRNTNKDSTVTNISEKTSLLVDNSKAQLEVINLPWEDVNSRSVQFGDVDIVLAADVVYDSTLFDSLCTALSGLLSIGHCKVVYLACTERNKQTLEGFLHLLEENNLSYEELELPSRQDYFCWDTEVPIRLFRVNRVKKISSYPNK